MKQGIVWGMMAGVMSLCMAAETSTNGYQLVWADEFDVDGPPNPKNWIFEQGFERNHELQWYQPDNAICKGGKLIIEGRREQKPNPKYKQDATYWGDKRPTIEYTSSSLKTRGLHSWQYGRFEIKARFKTQKGLWPAIWLLGDKGQWPSCGEIDIMEYYGHSILANACWGTEKRHEAKWDNSKKPMESFNDPAWDTKFHIWRMDWDSKAIKIYLDDLLLNTIDLAQTINPTDLGPKNPFQQPHYLLLNLAIGGNSGGDPSKTPFPSQYEIDYVRVYQKKPIPATAQPPKEENPVLLSFGLFTDAHYADAAPLGLRCYRASTNKLAECVKLMNDKQVDFLIELGDLKDQRNPPTEQTTLKDLDMIEKTFEQFDGPRYHVLGNHDMDSISKAQFLSRARNTGITNNASYYSFDAKGVHCIVLDANYVTDGSPYDHGKFDWKDANIPKQQLDWLRNDLESTTKPVIVFVHQQLDVETATGVKNAPGVRQILEKSKKVLAVFQGHHHPGHYSVINGIHYLTLNAMVEGNKPENNAYAIAEVREDLSIVLTGFRRVISREMDRHP